MENLFREIAETFGQRYISTDEITEINKATIALAIHLEDNEQVRQAVEALIDTDHGTYAERLLECRELIAQETAGGSIFLVQPVYNSALEESPFLLIYRTLKEAQAVAA